jgi:hypothetical protein
VSLFWRAGLAWKDKPICNEWWGGTGVWRLSRALLQIFGFDDCQLGLEQDSFIVTVSISLQLQNGLMIALNTVTDFIIYLAKE